MRGKEIRGRSQSRVGISQAQESGAKRQKKSEMFALPRVVKRVLRTKERRKFAALASDSWLLTPVSRLFGVHFRYARGDSQTRLFVTFSPETWSIHTNAPKFQRLVHVLARLGSL